MPLTPHIPPVSISQQSSDLVRRAFDRELDAGRASVGSGEADFASLQALERLTTRLLVRFEGWFGAAGTMALAGRALALVKRERKALHAVRLCATAPPLRGLDDTASLHGAPATVDGVLVMLSALLDIMGRLLNTELAARIFAQCAQLDHDAPDNTPAALSSRSLTAED